MSGGGSAKAADFKSSYLLQSHATKYVSLGATHRISFHGLACAGKVVSPFPPPNCPADLEMTWRFELNSTVRVSEGF